MSNATRPRPRTSAARPARRRVRLVPVSLALGAVLALVAVLVAVAGDDGRVTQEPAGFAETQPVTVTGSLPPLPARGADPAVGMPAPEVAGRSFDGTPVSLAADGHPKVVVFMAHWCPHCRKELPELVAWLKDGVAGDVGVVAVATGTKPELPGYPPSEWLQREDWAWPVVADDAAGTTAARFGMPGTPYYVAVGADGTVARRASGEVGRDGFAALVAAARGA